MALKYLGTLIAQAREETNETDYSDTNGTPQAVPVQAAREAVTHCQSNLYLAAPQVFDVVRLVSAVAAQTEYDLPANAFLGAGVASVEYSPDGNDYNYAALAYQDYAYRSGGSGTPSRFLSYGDGKFLVDPAPATSAGTFRIVYAADLDSPDIRRGTVSSVTKDVGMTNFLTIVLANDSNLSESAIALEDYLCVNDVDGNVLYYNVPFTAYDSATRTLTLGSAPVSGGTIPVGAYITLGKYSTTHIKLHKVTEPIILSYIRRRFYLGRSSDDRQSEEDNIAAFTKEMVAVYKRRIRTQKKIPFTGRFERIGRRFP